MSKRESATLALKRLDKLRYLQELHSDWLSFLEQVMYIEGFKMAEIQREIALFMADSDNKKTVIHAQRSQAKSTIARGYALYSLIHNPRLRVVLFTGESSLARKFSKAMIDLFYSMPELSFMLPDKRAGDRDSVEAFDIHHSLRGLDPHPSIAAKSLMSGIQGMRGDIILADDVETYSNSSSSVLREDLIQRFRDLPSICTNGRIIVLGTHQTTESIYKQLPDMGFKQRFWPGRVPTVEQREWYGENLAPSIQELYEDPQNRTGHGMDGLQGIPTCPEYLGEDVLVGKEQVQGGPFFQLQHMLNPTLSDASRKPLRTEMIKVVSLPHVNTLPVVLHTVGEERIGSYGFTRVRVDSSEYQEKPYVIATIDPALGGMKSGDRTGYVILGIVTGYAYILDCGSWKGGYSEELMTQWASTLSKYRPSQIIMESNAGNGIITQTFRPILQYYAQQNGWQVGLEDVRENGQKEVRGINRMLPVMGRGALVVTEDAIRSMEASLSDVEIKLREAFSLWYQINNVTYQRNSLLHDDTFDSLSLAIERARGRLQNIIKSDEAKEKATSEFITSMLNEGKSSVTHRNRRRSLL